MRLRGDRDDPRRHHGGPQTIEQQVGQQERREVVDGDRQLVAVLGQLKAGADQPGIVDQHVDARVVREDCLGEPAHCGEAGEIGERAGDPWRARPLGDEPSRPLGAAGIAADQHDLQPVAGEAERGMQSDPGAGAGNDGDRFGRARGHRRGAAPST